MSFSDVELRINETDFKDVKKEDPDLCNLNQLTVKFYTPDAKVFTQAYPSYYNIRTIKKVISTTFNVPINVVDLRYKEEHIPNHLSLNHFKPDKFGVLELKLQSTDKNYKIRVEQVYEELAVPDILTVRVEKDEEVKDVVVEVENRAVDKPYIGGYRDIQTGVQYHHGFTQTGPPPPKVPPEMKNHRDTQTYFTRNRRTEQDYSRATQMPNAKIYVPHITDRIITAGPYETADEREKRLDVEGKVRTIQRYFYAWMMRKKLKELSFEYHKRMRLDQEMEERDRIADEKRRKRDLVSKVFPVRASDFAMLFSMVDRWKKSEIARIASQHCGPSKISEFYLLLDKEIEIIQSIERLRMKVSKDLEIKRIEDFFKSIGNPIEWDSEYKHIHIQMDTLETQKGREYFALYQTLCNNHITKEERLQVYCNIKVYLTTHSCTEGAEIIKLIDRACELLARGMKLNQIKVLHKRIESLVLHHFKLLGCNEGVTHHMNKVKKRQMENNLYYCTRCQKLKNADAFGINARTERIKICAACKWLDKAEQPWVDLSPYKFILRNVRLYERLHKGTSSIAFILQPRDIHYIVTNIWHGHSALSECNDVYNLRLCRWRNDEEWSPWNCVLLTVEETKAHTRVENLEAVYEEEFRNHIFNKHALAKKHFPRLIEYDRRFAEYAAGDPKLDDESDYYNKQNKPDCLEVNDESDKGDE